jgi:hypothetical protein
VLTFIFEYGIFISTKGDNNSNKQRKRVIIMNNFKFTVINEYEECHTEWIEFNTLIEAIKYAIKINLSGKIAKVYKSKGETCFGKLFPANGCFKHHKFEYKRY